MKHLLCFLSALSVLTLAKTESLGLDEVASVRAAREGLEEAARFPWYDEQTDQLKAVPIKTTKPPQQSKDWEWKTPAGGRNWGGPLFWRLVQYVVLTVLALLFGLVLFLLLRSIAGRQIGKYGDLFDLGDDERTEADRIENLPFQVRSRTDLLGEARRHYEQGNYREAIIYLFSYQLVQLDKTHFIRLTKGKTNRQYLSEIRKHAGLRDLLARTMLSFEEVFFGNYQLSRGRFEESWKRMDEFHDLLKSHAV